MDMPLHLSNIQKKKKFEEIAKKISWYLVWKIFNALGMEKKNK